MYKKSAIEKFVDRLRGSRMNAERTWNTKPANVPISVPRLLLGSVERKEAIEQGRANAAEIVLLRV